MSKKKRLVKPEGPQGQSIDKSTYVLQQDKLREAIQIRNRYELTARQAVIVETAMDKSSKVVMIDGYWGTGKSSLAVLSALQLMNQKKVGRIVYIRNPLESTSSGKVGTLPGSLEDRMAPYNVILFDKLAEFLVKADIDRLKKEERIECIPVSFLQGKTFNACAVIIDEAASMSYDDLLLAISRIGEHCKVFIIGDSTFQLSIGSRSGFRRFFNHFMDTESQDNGIFTFELKQSEDIKRSGLIRFVMHKLGIVPKIAPEAHSSDWEPGRESSE